MAADIKIIAEVVGKQEIDATTKSIKDLGFSTTKLAKDMKAYEDNLERLRRKYIQGHAAMDAYSKELNDIAVATKNKILTDQQAKVALDNLNKATKNGTVIADGYGNAMQRSTRGIGQFSTFTQQAGYQVGDFLVQIQSGTNPMVAFGQQATQVAGTLTLFGGAMVGVGTALGIAIPLLTAVGAYWMRTRDSTDSASVALGDWSKAAETAFEKAKALKMELDATAQGFRDVGQAALTMALEQAQSDLDALRARGRGNQRVSEDVYQQLIEYNEELVRLAQERLDLYNDTNAQQRAEQAGADAFASHVSAYQQEQKDQAQAIADAQADILRNNDEYEKQQDGIRKSHQDTLRTLQQETALNLMMLQFGKDSVAVQNLRNQQEITNLGIKLKALGYTDDQIKAEQEALRTLQNTQDRLAAAAVEGRNLADALREAASAMASLSSFSAGLDKAIAVASAKVQALKTGANEAVAGQIAGLQADLSTRLEAAREAGADRQDLVKIREEGQGKISTLEGLLSEGAGLRESKKKPAGSSEKAEDYLRKLELEAEYKQKIIGLSEREARVMEIRTELEKKKLPIDDERIQQIVDMEEKTRKLMEAEKQREQLMDTIESNIENAFMSMVDGSKSVEDAFKSMLRNIILAIYQEKVAKAGANAIMSLLGLANGGAFERGGKFTAYANGGVVGSPTMFSHSGGLGVMGEAGPEAIMPLKRGKNGKLGVQMEGNAGNVTVVQNFNMSANGDESVKRIIRQETPRIAEQAKAAVVDAKRRGGSYGRSF